ncbi:hypothetical protein, partial [Roseobacter sp. HKCCD8284]
GSVAGVLLPETETVNTDGSGNISISLYTGYYLVETTVEGKVWRFTIVVPNEATATFSNLITQDVIIATDSLEQTIQARNDAVTAKNEAQDFANATEILVSKYYDSMAELLADTTNFAEGDTLFITTGKTSFKVAPSSELSPDETRTDGVKLYEAGPTFTTRARFIAAIGRNQTWPDGTIITAESDYKATAGSTQIPDAAGFNVIPDKNRYNVKAFGALGNGLTNDAAAIQAAFDAVEVVANSAQWPGSSTFASVSPEVLLPDGGEFRIDSTINVEGHRFVRLVSDGRALIVGNTSGTKTVTAFSGSGVRYLEVEGVQFNNLNKAFVISSGNLNSSKYVFRDVICDSTNLFLDTDTYALSRSTIVNFDSCVFESDVVQVAQAYVDCINVRDSWIACRSSSTDTFHVNSLINFSGCMFIPAGSATIGGSWVRLTEDNGAGGTTTEQHRGVHFSDCRFSNEGSNHTIVVNDYDVIGEEETLTPTINFHACSINGFHGVMYENGNSESGLVYLLKYPASVSFKDCGFFTLGNAEGALVAKTDSLVANPHDGFRIDVDDTTFSNAMRAVGATTTKQIARSLRSYIKNPDPYTFRDILEDGHLSIAATGTTGQKKATFTIQTGWTNASSRTPITFFLFLGGQGRTGGTTNIQYAGGAVYLVTITGVFEASAHKSKISFTKLHGGAFGNGETSNADIISMHFGTADTGNTTENLATSHSVTVAFGTQMEYGIARIEPLVTKWSRYWNVLRG